MRGGNLPMSSQSSTPSAIPRILAVREVMLEEPAPAAAAEVPLPAAVALSLLLPEETLRRFRRPIPITIPLSSSCSILSSSILSSAFILNLVVVAARGNLKALSVT